METVRILRVGEKARAFRPTTESFRKLVREAEERVKRDAENKRRAVEEWIAGKYPKAAGDPAGVRTQLVTAGRPGAGKGPMRVRYGGTAPRYMGHVIGRSGPPLDPVSFGSDASGLPGFFYPPAVFPFERGKTKINPGLDGVIAAMQPGERRIAIVPAALAYGSDGYYRPEVPGQRRFVISPEALLVYEVEVLAE
jgi:peptidylprolyl isomerase